MSKRLMADGNTGRVAIIEGGSRDAFERPTEHFEKIHFHSDLDYMVLTQKIAIPSITLPAHEGTYRIFQTSGGKKSSGKTYRLPNIVTGRTEFVIGASVGNDGDPLMGFINGAPITGLSIYDRNGGQERARRFISISNRNGQIILTDNWLTGGYSLPAQTVTNILLLKMELRTDANPISPYTLRITPGEFIASKGKLDSRARYMRKVPNASAPFFFFDGRTMDSRSGGIRRAVIGGSGYVDDGIYNGVWLPNGYYGVNA